MSRARLKCGNNSEQCCSECATPSQMYAKAGSSCALTWDAGVNPRHALAANKHTTAYRKNPHPPLRTSTAVHPYSLPCGYSPEPLGPCPRAVRLHRRLPWQHAKELDFGAWCCSCAVVAGGPLFLNPVSHKTRRQ